MSNASGTTPGSALFEQKIVTVSGVVANDLVTAGGGNPIVTYPPRIYFALGTGVVDGAIVPA